MAKVDTWMPIYIGDYLADTGHLTTEEHGAYLLLMFHYWRKGPLPADERRLSSIAGIAGDAWSNAWAMLKHSFIEAEDGLLHHKRIDHELKEAGDKRQKSTERAEKAAKARWGDAPSNAQASPQALLKECPSPSPSPTKNISEAKASSPRNDSGKIDPIEAIYLQYPRKVGKQGAAKAIARAIQHVKARGMPIREAQEWLYRRVQEYARSPAGNDGPGTPHPARWFNDGRYDDDAKEWQIKNSERGSNGHRSESRTRLEPGDAEAVIELFGSGEASEARPGGGEALRERTSRL